MIIRHELPGGYINKVIREGDTVRRPGGTDYSRKLLRELKDWPGAPNFLGTDEQGREVLSYIDGLVPWDKPLYSTQALASTAKLLREFHELTKATVCHNDLSPKNTVYRGQTAVAFIDWDNAAPGEPIHDLAHMCWQFTELGGEITKVRAQIQVLTSAYGAEANDELIDTMLWWQDRCWRGIETEAAQGDPARIKLRDDGVVQAIQQTYEWTLLHRNALISH